MLDDLRETATEFTIRERAQKFRVCDHQPRRIECADEILAFRKIHAGFPAYGAVHLSDQSGGHMNESHAAQIRSGHKASHVAHNAAADCDNQRLPIGSRAAEGTRNVLDAAKMFCRFHN